MANSIDGAGKASNFGKLPKKKAKGKQGSTLDTPEAREARILLYMSRYHNAPETETGEGRKTGKNGRPLNLFDGEEYKEDEIHGVDFEGE